jgi:hypothetical protein
VIPYAQHFKVKIITSAACQKYVSNFEKKLWLLYGVLLVLRTFLKSEAKIFGEKRSKKQRINMQKHLPCCFFIQTIFSQPTNKIYGAGILLIKFIVAQLHKKSPAFYGAQRFIAVFITARH